MNYMPKRSDAIQTTSLPDGLAVLVNNKTNWAHTLSPLGALVWEFCDGLHSADQIVAELGSIPEVASRSTLRQEVIDLLAKFDEDGFVEED
jgi:hypothetical protein